MSVHTTFDNAQPAALPVVVPPCVLRFAGLKPRQLSLFKMHDGRTGGDLAHVNLSLTSFNRLEHGAANWIAKLTRRIKVISTRNLQQEVAALRAKNRPTDASKRLQSGLQMPCHKSTDSPLREGIITVHKNWFGGTGRDKWDEDKVDLFRRYAMTFLHKHFPKGQLQYAASHSDEEAFHIHFVVAVWDVRTSKNRGQQIQLCPAANPILRSYELAQDLVGEYMKEIGITRGERRAEARRLAIAAGEKVPKKRRHVPPSEFREDERRKGREDAQVIRDAAVEDCEMARKKTKSRASRVVRAARRKARNAEKRRVAVQTETARLAARQGGLTTACADAERKLEKTQAVTSIIMEDALELSTKTVRKSRKRAIKDAKARKLAADKLVQEAAQKYASEVEAATQAARKAAAADVARRDDEAAAALAQSQTASATQMEAEAKAEEVNALQLRDQRLAEIDIAASAQKLIDEARLRDLEAISKSNASVRQLITLEQGGLAQDRTAHAEDLRRKRAGTDARKAALLIENERLAQVVELVNQAGLARRADEYAAEAARSKAADAKRAAVAAKEKAAHFKDLVKDAEASLDILMFGRNEVTEAKEIAIVDRDAARVDETVARAEAAAALETRDARLADIATAAAAQKQIDDARQRELDATGKENAATKREITARQDELKAGEQGFKSIINELIANTLKIRADGQLVMKDSKFAKAMPKTLRVFLVPLVKTIIDLKLRLSERLAVVETRIRKIEDFLKRDDLTVDARVEAEDLRTPNWSGGVDDPS